jgi:hypothetical protein
MSKAVDIFFVLEYNMPSESNSKIGGVKWVSSPHPQRRSSGRRAGALPERERLEKEGRYKQSARSLKTWRPERNFREGTRQQR